MNESLVIALVSVAISLALLFFVVRASILSALAEHHRRVARATARAQVVTTHMDEDGL